MTLQITSKTTVTELKAEARARRLKGYSAMRKADLIALLSKDDADWKAADERHIAQEATKAAPAQETPAPAPRFNGLRVGDRVMYTFNFVQRMSSHADYSKRRGTITELPPEGHNLIKIAWDDAKPGSLLYFSAHNITAAKKVYGQRRF